MMDNRELFDEVAGTYKREVTVIDLTRGETLRAIFFPILVNYYDWKEHPERYTPTSDMETYLDAGKQFYKVTDQEWKTLLEEYHNGPKG